MRDRRRSAALVAALVVFVGACGVTRPAGEAEFLRAAEVERALRSRELAALLASRPVPVAVPDLVVDPVCTGYGPGLRGTGIDLGSVVVSPLPFGEGAPGLLLAADGGCPRAAEPASGPAPRG